MAVIFKYGATTFTCSRDPAMGNFSIIRKWMNPSIRSGGGKLFVYDKSIIRDIVTLTWRNMNPTDLINLLAFLVIIDGSANSFRFTDPKGKSSVVYFWEPSKIMWTPMELMQRDFSIELLIILFFPGLTDELGNKLTDESGNHLISNI